MVGQFWAQTPNNPMFSKPAPAPIYSVSLDRPGSSMPDRAPALGLRGLPAPSHHMGIRDSIPTLMHSDGLPAPDISIPVPASLHFDATSVEETLGAQVPSFAPEPALDVPKPSALKFPSKRKSPGIDSIVCTKQLSLSITSGPAAVARFDCSDSFCVSHVARNYA